MTPIRAVLLKSLRWDKNCEIFNRALTDAAAVLYSSPPDTFAIENFAAHFRKNISMPLTELILTESVPGLGAEADVVKVRRGYARNYLLPRGMAYEVTLPLCAS